MLREWLLAIVGTSGTLPFLRPNHPISQGRYCQEQSMHCGQLYIPFLWWRCWERYASCRLQKKFVIFEVKKNLFQGITVDDCEKSHECQDGTCGNIAEAWRKSIEIYIFFHFKFTNFAHIVRTLLQRCSPCSLLILCRMVLVFRSFLVSQQKHFFKQSNK